MNRSLREFLASGAAIGAYNFNDQFDLRGIVDGLNKSNCPGVLLVSTRAVDYASLDLLYDLYLFYRKRSDVPLWVELDHCSDIVLIQRAAELGFDIVMADFSALAFGENMATTQHVTNDVHEAGCLVEGEVAPIPAVAGGRALKCVTTPSELREFVRRTQVDLVSPNLGTIHGFSREKPSLDGGLIASMVEASTVPIVAHGCDFLTDAQIATLVCSGVQKLNFGPQLRVAFSEGMHLRADDPSREPDHRALHRHARERVERTVARIAEGIERTYRSRH